MSAKGLDLSGRVAVVLGGTSGIGLALARGLAEAGADVVPSSRRAGLVEEAAGQVEALGRRTLRLASDVADRRSMEALRDAALAAFGRVDILVNSAGRNRRTPTLEVGEDEWNGIFDVNLTGTLRACQVFGRPMLERGAGRIVNIASLGSFLGLFGIAAYCASKAGVASLTKTLAAEWGPRGVNVNAIAPGVFDTPMNEGLEASEPGRELVYRTPLGRLGRVEELVGACVFLASDAASFVNGEVMVVDGGFLASGLNR